MVPVTEGPVTKCLLYSDYDLKTEHSQYRFVSAIIIVKKMVLVGVVFKKKPILCKKFFPWSCLVLFYITIFSTQQENSWAVLNSRNRNTKFQIPEFLFHFRDWVGTGKRMFPNPRDRKKFGSVKKRDRERRPLNVHRASGEILVWLWLYIVSNLPCHPSKRTTNWLILISWELFCRPRPLPSKVKERSSFGSTSPLN